MSEQIDDNVIPLAPPRMVPPGLTSGDDSRGLPSVTKNGNVTVTSTENVTPDKPGQWLDERDVLSIFKIDRRTLFRWKDIQRVYARKAGRVNEWFISSEMLEEEEEKAKKSKKKKHKLPPGSFAPTDLGNSERIERHCGAELKHCTGLGWLWWDGKRWTAEDGEKAALRAVHDLHHWVSNEAIEGESEALDKWAVKSQSRAVMLAGLNTYRDRESAVIRYPQLDSQPWLLNVQNGWIDLRDNRYYPNHDREHYATKLAGFAWDGNAECKGWLEFLYYALQGDQEMVDYLQRWVGYSLTGYTHIEEFVYVLGVPGTGKNTFVDRVRKLMGEYGDSLKSSSLMQKMGEAIPVDLAKLRGKRMVACQEASSNQRWDEALIASIVSGSSEITARFMRENEFSFEPICKLYMHGNSRPRITTVESGLFRRLREIEFSELLLKGMFDTRGEEDFKAYLDRYELPGIANWALEGWAKVRATGTTDPPKSVLARIEMLHEVLDVFGQFCAETFTKDFTLAPDMPPPRLSINLVVWDLYNRWWERHSKISTDSSSAALVRRLMERGYQVERAGDDWEMVGVMVR